MSFERELTVPPPRQSLAEDTCVADADIGFAQLVGVAEARGANLGLASVIALYRGWISQRSAGDPHLHVAWFNLGVELSRAGDSGGAILAYRMSFGLRPDFHVAAINLGLLLEQGGAPQAALDIWAQALQPDDARTALLNHQARCLEQTGRLDEAERTMLASLLTNPLQPDVIQHWLHLRQMMCAWPVMTEAVPGLSPAMQAEYCGPLAALALYDTVAAQTAIAAGWLARKTAPAPARLSPTRGYRHDRIRVGYMSSDFCRHAMSFLIAELFERHDRAAFEIYGYCSSPEDGSAIRRRVVSAFDHLRPIRALSDEAAAQLIRQDEIDVLIDLNGLTRGSRLPVLRWRPAPVQATYLGFVGPVPLPELDYLFCDEYVIPPALAALYRPTPLAIGATYQANDSRREIGPPMSRAQAGVPEDAFLFCCFSNHYKITEPMFAAWLRILRQVDCGVLWLTADNVWSCASLRCEAAKAGIDPSRLIFADRVGPADYMARLRVADLFLDTYPYNAGTIASDAIRMGVPLVTQCGEAFASRMAARLLSAIGADAGIAGDTDAYVGKAVAFARDTEAYAGFRSLFATARWSETIGDIDRLTRELEATLRRITLDGGAALAAA